MNNEVRELQEWNKSLEQENRSYKNRLLGAEATFSQLSVFNQDKPTNIAEIQMSFDKELNQAYHSLAGHEIRVINNREVWVETSDDRLRILSDYGVKRIMSLLSMYLNKNNIMAFYDEETIKWKVRDFAIELTDLIGNRYEVLIHYPSPEQLFESYINIIKKNPENYRYLLIDNGNGEYLLNEQLIYEKCQKYSEDELKAKEREVPSLILALVDMVHASYSRAFQGKERTSYGEKSIQISQRDESQYSQRPNEKKGLFGMGGNK